MNHVLIASRLIPFYGRLHTRRDRGGGWVTRHEVEWTYGNGSDETGGPPGIKEETEGVEDSGRQ